MKLYLTSYRIPHPAALFELIGKEPGTVNAAVIPNAKDYYAQRARDVKIRDTVKYLEDCGIAPTLVDLNDYLDGASLKKALASADMLWVMGGNTFCLRSAIKSSGFEIIINDLLDDGIIYAGESAGACVAGNSLEGIDKADNPEFSEEIIWSGLNLIPNFILPHTDNPGFAEDIAYNRELHKDDPSLVELKDSEALVVSGDEWRIVSREMK